MARNTKPLRSVIKDGIVLSSGLFCTFFAIGEMLRACSGSGLVLLSTGLLFLGIIDARVKNKTAKERKRQQEMSGETEAGPFTDMWT